MNRTLIAAALLLGSAVAATAGSIDEARERQEDRIEEGRRDGTITWTEGLALRAEQNRIARAEAEFGADGYLSPSERRELRAMQEDAAEHIADEADDDWARVPWLPRVGR